MKKIITAGVAALALTLTACGGADGAVEVADAETSTTSATPSTSTPPPTQAPPPEETTPAGAPTTEEAMMNYHFVETITSGLNIYQQPDTDNYHLCVMHGEAPGYEFITDTGCSEAMTYDALGKAVVNSWDSAFPDSAPSDTPGEFIAPEAYVPNDNSGSDEFMACIEAGGSGATCRR